MQVLQVAMLRRWPLVPLQSLPSGALLFALEGTCSQVERQIILDF
jgi:hypothetical protein